ncbi:hypothetical protein AS026_31895 [Rhizobium altiplani]|uniref:Uncharacterized protein n=1 Tax=Rhizobium altiplani TaxID=1864509 RepID=A0A120FPJ9_9HYPH|nr:hypothetical protein AS026_31895 [Rhizobium altiplani]
MVERKFLSGTDLKPSQTFASLFPPSPLPGVRGDGRFQTKQAQIPIKLEGLEKAINVAFWFINRGKSKLD